MDTIKPLPTTSYAILGLLARQPRSRYDLALLVQQTIAHFWTIAKSQVYGELGRLEQLGYVRGRDVRQERLPDKRLYWLTAEGTLALDRWLQQSDTEPTRFRSAYLVKIFFGQRMSAETLADLLRQYRDGNEAWRHEIRAIVDRLAGVREATYSRATALLGLRIAEAMVAWADEVAAELAHARTGNPRADARSRRRKKGPIPKRGVRRAAHG